MVETCVKYVRSCGLNLFLATGRIYNEGQEGGEGTLRQMDMEEFRWQNGWDWDWDWYWIGFGFGFGFGLGLDWDWYWHGLRQIDMAEFRWQNGYTNGFLGHFLVLLGVVWCSRMLLGAGGCS